MSDDADLTWPRWLGRAAAFGLVVGLGAVMFSLGRVHGGANLTSGGIVAVGVVFFVGGCGVALWEQIRPTNVRFFWRRTSWSSWPVWLIEIVAVGGLGFLAGTITQG